MGIPLGAGFHHAVAERFAGPAHELVIAGGPGSAAAVAMRDASFRAGGPMFVIGHSGIGRAGPPHAMLADRPLPPGAGAAAYLCRDHTCLPPVTEPAALAALLARRRS